MTSPATTAASAQRTQRTRPPRHPASRMNYQAETQDQYNDRRTGFKDGMEGYKEILDINAY
jgi:hypothetical protein